MRLDSKARKPYVLGALLILLGISSFLSDGPTNGKFGPIDPDSKKAAGVILIVCGTGSIVFAIRKR